jgi:hypothetical protein
MHHSVRTRFIGIVLMVVLVAAFVQSARFDWALSRERDAGAATDQTFNSIELAIAHLRGAQAGYLATGQNPATWFTRAAEYATRIEADLGRLRVASQTPTARADYDAATAALATLNEHDGRAREYVKTDQRFLASDVVFMDAVDKLTSAVGAARADEASASRARFNETLLLRAGAVLLGLAAAIGLVLTVARSRPRAAAPAVKAPATTAEMLKNLPPALKPPPPPVVATAPVAQPVTTSATLVEAADLCVDLARLSDGRDVPALVERAAKVLDAKGMVLWTADPGGAVLKPSVSHGYPDKVLSRLGPLLIDSDNVTSLAFRSMRPQAMTSAVPGNSGALAVPLITAHGCVGVLAAEIKQNRSSTELMPLAKIIAAQFAALMAPSDVPAQRTAQA